jgi:hypothetical protein
MPFLSIRLCFFSSLLFSPAAFSFAAFSIVLLYQLMMAAKHSIAILGWEISFSVGLVLSSSVADSEIPQTVGKSPLTG